MRLLLFFLAAAIVANSQECPHNGVYNQDIGKCFVFRSSPLSFIAAEQDCISMRGHLTPIDGGFDNALVTESAPRFFPLSTDSFWIGGSDLYSQVGWMWVDWTKVVYARWANGEPNISVGQCVSIESKSGKWRASDCKAPMPYVCRTPPLDEQCTTSTTSTPITTTQSTTVASTTTTTPPTTTRPGYCTQGNYYHPTDSCYFRETMDDDDGYTWNQASSWCQQNGGELASIHSDDENEFINRISETGSSHWASGQPWIGMYQDQDDQFWKWSDGTPVDYYNWQPDQPDNPKTEHCVQTFPDAAPFNDASYHKWNNWDCSKQADSFICKVPAKH